MPENQVQALDLSEINYLIGIQPLRGPLSIILKELSIIIPFTGNGELNIQANLIRKSMSGGKIPSLDVPRIAEPIENEDERLSKVANDYCIS